MDLLEFVVYFVFLSLSLFHYRPRHCPWVLRRLCVMSSNWRCRIWRCPERLTLTRSACGWKREAALRRWRQHPSIAIRRLILWSVTNCRSLSRWTVYEITLDGRPLTMTTASIWKATATDWLRPLICWIIATISTTQIRPLDANSSSGDFWNIFPWLPNHSSFFWGGEDGISSLISP